MENSFGRSMNKDEVERLWHEAYVNGMLPFEQRERFANLVAAAERNACASACRQIANAYIDSTDALSVGINHGAISCAIAIELRGGNKCAAS